MGFDYFQLTRSLVWIDIFGRTHLEGVSVDFGWAGWARFEFPEK